MNSIILFVYNKNKISLVFLLFASLFIYLFAATLYPFLNVWDERFHALVARNLMNHPLMPTLYDDPVINMEYNRWDRYHIWLHKQPLFLWQIALSFKVFGINELALRIPSVILGTFVVFAVYRSGSLMGNSNVGYFSAFLLTTSFYLIELLSGYQMLDQNDFVFMCYVTLSIWSFIEFTNSKKILWIICIGVFSGFAVLCKWLPGLLVYLIWFLFDIKPTLKTIKISKFYFLSLLITFFISVPWQILIFSWYPTEAASSYKYNFDHFTIPLDGHTGSFFYHIDLIGQIYGVVVPYIIIISLILFINLSQNRKLATAATLSIIFVYLFYGVTATKMPSFTIISILPIFIALGFFMDFLFKFYLERYFHKASKSIIFFCLLILGFLRIDFYKLREKHGFMGHKSEYALIQIENKEIFENLKLPFNYVLFNIKSRHYIEAMFYTGLPAYNFIPTTSQIEELKKENRRAVIFTYDSEIIPNELVVNNDILILKRNIRKAD